jgi:hypothetical protein
MALSTSAGSGNITNQANTQSPQTSAGSGSPTGTPGKNVQPGTATSLLNGGSEGVPLTSTALSVVSLNTSTRATTQPQATKPQNHHLNPVLLTIVIVFFVLAVIFFWQTARSAKNTTNY